MALTFVNTIVAWIIFVGDSARAANLIRPLICEGNNWPVAVLSASSSWSDFHSSHKSCLDKVRTDTGNGGWAVRSINYDQWIRADLSSIHRVYSIVTQENELDQINEGRDDLAQYVSKYRLAISSDATTWVNVLNSANQLHFQANADSNTKVEHIFRCFLVARYVKLFPTQWHDHISMRWEVYGFPVDSGVDQLPQMSTFISTQLLSANDEGTCRFLETKTGVQCAIMCKKNGRCQSFKFYKDIQYCEIVEMTQSESQNDSQGNFYYEL